MSESDIFCPKCRWKPTPVSRWWCTPKIGGCGHLWNTFDTRGVCPKCSWKWIITACLSCKRFSPHEDWYHDTNEDLKEVEEERAVAEVE
jgi:hypothetical protein